MRADEAPSHPRPDPKRFANSIAAFDDEEKTNQPARGGIVFTGSSSVRLWKLDEAFPGLPVLNRGFGGSVANDLIVYADEVALRYRPKILVIYTGSNDLNAKLTPDEALADYTRFLSLAHEKLPATRVIVNSVKVAPVRAAQMESINKLNALLEAWCKDKPWIRWVNATSCLIGSDGRPIEALYRSDRLHLNDAGYAKWNAIIGPVLHEEWTKVHKWLPDDFITSSETCICTPCLAPASFPCTYCARTAIEFSVRATSSPYMPTLSDGRRKWTKRKF